MTNSKDILLPLLETPEQKYKKFRGFEVLEKGLDKFLGIKGINRKKVKPVLKNER